MSQKVIRENITLCGKLGHAGTLRFNKKDEVYINFTVNVSLSSGAGSTNMILHKKN